jgi:small GTP-binding protein domain
VRIAFALIGLALKFKAFPPDPTEVFVNVVFLGDTGVGKSSLITRFISGDDAEIDHMIPTVGRENFMKTISDENTKSKFIIYDTAGQEQYRSLTPFSLRYADIAVIVCSPDNPKSADEIGYWIDLTKEYASDSNLVFVINKIDLDKAKVETIKQGVENKYSAEGYPVLLTSALTGAGMSDLSEIFCSIAFTRACMVQDRLAAGEMPLRLSEEFKNGKKPCCK